MGKVVLQVNKNARPHKPRAVYQQPLTISCSSKVILLLSRLVLIFLCLSIVGGLVVLFVVGSQFIKMR